MRAHGSPSTVPGAGTSGHVCWVHDDEHVDDAVVPSEALADAASAHPLGRAPEGVPQFQVFFVDGRVVLTGSVDTFGAERLARVLASSPTTRATVLDLDRLDFVDAAGCRAIALWACELSARGVPVEIQGASRLFRRIWHILTLSDVAPVAFAEVAA